MTRLVVDHCAIIDAGSFINVDVCSEDNLLCNLKRDWKHFGQTFRTFSRANSVWVCSKEGKMEKGEHQVHTHLHTQFQLLWRCKRLGVTRGLFTKVRHAQWTSEVQRLVRLVTRRKRVLNSFLSYMHVWETSLCIWGKQEMGRKTSFP